MVRWGYERTFRCVGIRTTSERRIFDNTTDTVLHIEHTDTVLHIEHTDTVLHIEHTDTVLHIEHTDTVLHIEHTDTVLHIEHNLMRQSAHSAEKPSESSPYAAEHDKYRLSHALLSTQGRR
ncbi:hypothetical protein DPMN_177770 [Dreissena polymorpha]|uniref:Uncharacterized protein n=1 Tax=Dreissena polymorpha TaxID=45954 RepID=A0A9D4EAW8_DREPO|nr:hypothetical protein DPMN_177770 [Dreissena polymorpha]